MTFPSLATVAMFVFELLYVGPDFAVPVIVLVGAADVFPTSTFVELN